MDLNAFMNDGTEDILHIARRHYLKSARGTRFLARIAASFARDVKTREEHERNGLHVPPFLIASIASECNLDCVGCYAHVFGTTTRAARDSELSDEAWDRIFDEANRLGVSFILLAGGEPLLRRGVIERAAKHKGIVFPVFTNGTLVDKDFLELADRSRNIVPVLSTEGSDEQTDARRGPGVSQRVRSAIEGCNSRSILWGTSLTVTTENLDEVTSDGFMRDLHARGCGLVICNEFVPVGAGTAHLALSMEGHNRLMERMDAIYRDDSIDGMIVVAFPGNEEFMGGCLAAGRGFFHISQAGAAEPCPFSPFSVANVAEVGLEGALRSSFFSRVRAIEAAHADEHMGGCTLFLHRAEVEKAVSEMSQSAV